MSNLIKKYQNDLDLCSRQKQALQKRRNEDVMELFRLREANAKGTVFAPQIKRKKEKFQCKFQSNGFMPKGSLTGGGASSDSDVNEIEESLVGIAKNVVKSDFDRFDEILTRGISELFVDVDKIDSAISKHYDLDEEDAGHKNIPIQKVFEKVFVDIKDGIIVNKLLFSSTREEVERLATMNLKKTQMLRQDLREKELEQELEQDNELKSLDEEWRVYTTQKLQELERANKKNVNERQQIINRMMIQKRKIEQEMEQANEGVTRQNLDIYYMERKIKYGLIFGIILLTIFIMVVLILKQKLMQKQLDYTSLEYETEELIKRNEYWRLQVQQCDSNLSKATKLLNDTLNVELLDEFDHDKLSEFVPNIDDVSVPEAIIGFSQLLPVLTLLINMIPRFGK